MPETLTNLVNIKRADFRYNNFLTSGYSPALLAFLNQSFVFRLPQTNPQSCAPLEGVNVYINVNNSHEETQTPKYVLGGDSASAVPFVAGFEIFTDSGVAIVHDLTVLTDGPGVPDFADSVDEMIIYDEDLVTVLDNELVTNNNQVVFDNIDLIV